MTTPDTIHAAIEAGKALHLDPITEAALEAIVARVRDETGIVPALGAHDAEAFKRGI